MFKKLVCILIVLGFFAGCTSFELTGFKAVDGDKELTLEHVEGSTE